jgi:dephospho-CoA kinase
VKRDRENFIETNTSKILVFDIPLLFELGTQTKFDAVACVTISSKIQEERVLSRSGMTKKHLDVIISKQLSSAEKVARSDYVIDTTSMKSAEMCVENILKNIEERQKNA